MIPVVFAASPGGTLVFCPPHMCNKLHGSNSSVRYPEVSAASNGSRNVSNDDGLELGSLTWRGKKEDSQWKTMAFPDVFLWYALFCRWSSAATRWALPHSSSERGRVKAVRREALGMMGTYTSQSAVGFGTIGGLRICDPYQHIQHVFPWVQPMRPCRPSSVGRRTVTWWCRPIWESTFGELRGRWRGRWRVSIMEFYVTTTTIIYIYIYVWYVTYVPIILWCMYVIVLYIQTDIALHCIALLYIP